MNYVILNGIKSTMIKGLLIQSLPPISKPLMRTEVEEIDGRDGDIVTRLGFSAYDKTITVGLHGDFDIDQVIGFFSTEGTITFSNEPDKVYRFQTIAQIDFDRLIRFRVATVTFHVQPFKHSLMESAKVLEIESNSLNLIPFNMTKNGITVTVNNGLISVYGTSESATEFYLPIEKLTLPIGNYTLTAYGSGANVGLCSVRLVYNSPSPSNSFGGQSVTLQDGVGVTIEESPEYTKVYNYLYLYIVSGTMNFTLAANLESNDHTLTIWNNGNYVSKPIITIYGLDTISIYLNDHLAFTVDLADEEYITIDTEHMEASKDGALKNRLVRGNYDAFQLNVGQNIVRMIGTVEKVIFENYSRWL